MLIFNRHLFREISKDLAKYAFGLLIGCTKKVDVPDGVSTFFCVVVQGIIRGVISVFSVISKFRILYLLSVLSKPPDVLKKCRSVLEKHRDIF